MQVQMQHQSVTLDPCQILGSKAIEVVLRQ